MNQTIKDFIFAFIAAINTVIIGLSIYGLVLYPDVKKRTDCKAYECVIYKQDSLCLISFINSTIFDPCIYKGHCETEPRIINCDFRNIEINNCPTDKCYKNVEGEFSLSLSGLIVTVMSYVLLFFPWIVTHNQSDLRKVHYINFIGLYFFITMCLGSFSSTMILITLNNTSFVIVLVVALVASLGMVVILLYYSYEQECKDNYINHDGQIISGVVELEE